jgi:pimeloyl-ACP methyl ester carboxylesterase
MDQQARDLEDPARAAASPAPEEVDPTPEATPRGPHPARRAAEATGHALLMAGAWVGRTARSAYRTVDPDLRMHLAQIPLVGLTLLGPGDDHARNLPDDGHRPLVFVHGLGGAAGNFVAMRAFFDLAGRTRSYAPRLPGHRTMQELGTFLADFLEEVVQVNGLQAHEQIDLVAHSMGGLVARGALQDPRLRSRVATLLTLGTPHSGSHLARYGGQQYSRDLRPDSALLQGLASQIPWRGPPDQPRLICFWSPADVALLPATSACVVGAENVELPGFTHYAYLIHPRAWARAIEVLGR